jgi:hypothetical protein
MVVRRRKLRQSIGHYVDGLLSGLERKTGWLLAERAGEPCGLLVEFQR